MKVSNPHPGITVYDDVFGWIDQNDIHTQLYNGVNYTLGWIDHFNGSDVFLHSTYSVEDWKMVRDDPQQFNGHLLDRLAKSEPFQEMADQELIKSVVNLTTVADTNEAHCHPNQDVVLYYANLEWKSQWQGETQFYDRNTKEVLYTSPYVPNRMIKFDGEIVHRFNTQCRTAPKFRLIISSFWDKPHGPALSQEGELATEEELKLPLKNQY